MRVIPPVRVRPWHFAAREDGHVGVAGGDLTLGRQQSVGCAVDSASTGPLRRLKSPRECDMVDETPRLNEPEIDPPGEPTQAEIDAWVAAERARREAWLK